MGNAINMEYVIANKMTSGRVSTRLNPYTRMSARIIAPHIGPPVNLKTEFAASNTVCQLNW